MLVDTFRLIAIGASLATTFVIAAVCRRVRPARAAFAVAAFGLNPVILFQSAGSGHNDLLVALAIAIARVVRAPPGGRTGRSRSLTAGALVKATAFLPLVLLVVWVAWRRPPGERLRGAVHPRGARVGHHARGRRPSSNRTIRRSGCSSSRRTKGGSRPPGSSARLLDAISGDTMGVVARVAFAIALVATVVWLVRAIARGAAAGRPSLELLGGWGWALLALTLLGPVLLPWYLAWSLPLIWILPRVPRVCLIALSAVLALSQWTAEPLRFPDAYDLNVLIGHYVLTPDRDRPARVARPRPTPARWRSRFRCTTRKRREPAEARQGRGGERDRGRLQA